MQRNDLESLYLLNIKKMVVGFKNTPLKSQLRVGKHYVIHALNYLCFQIHPLHVFSVEKVDGRGH